MCCDENAVYPLSEAAPEAPVTLQPPPPPLPENVERVEFTEQELVILDAPIVIEPSPELQAVLTQRDQVLALLDQVGMSINTEENHGPATE